MLNSMRNLAGSFFAKILLILLLLSFGVWGIEDMLRYSGKHVSLGSVGGQEISRTAFEHSYQRERERARQMLGKNYSPEMVKMLGDLEPIARPRRTQPISWRPAPGSIPGGRSASGLETSGGEALKSRQGALYCPSLHGEGRTGLNASRGQAGVAQW